MRRTTILGLLLTYVFALPQDPEKPPKPISSRILDGVEGEQILLQEVRIDAPVQDVWNAYVTEDGYTSWAAPVAEIDLRAGGTIRSHYDPRAEIGDPGTNTLHIVNYVPERILTLRAETADNWPEIMKQDAENLMNVVLFEADGPERTRIQSYGVGYRKTPEYDRILKFFMPANEGLFRKLERELED